MTPLRKNLDRAKASYGATRYRGDLARDVLGSLELASPTHAMNPWPHRLIAIAAAVALSATTFFAGNYFGRSTNAQRQEIAIVAPSVKSSVNTVTETVAPTNTPTNAVANSTQAGDFTLVPTLASAGSSQASSQANSETNSQTASTAQTSSDFSLSVPSAPMLFSLATLADQETTTDTGTDDESEKRS